jgi:hypothetical protein
MPDEFLRTRRRAMRADGTKALGGKARKRKRIETLDAEHARHAQSHTFH